MCKKLTVISGKGGSGKTSFSLAFSKMLSNLGFKVLLVDCDMSTHGATFFMKPKIERHRNNQNKIASVDDILLSKDMPPYGFFSKTNEINELEEKEFNYEILLHVEEKMYFLPSDISITNSKNDLAKYRFDIFKRCIHQEIEKHFDIIILDCQAGYSEFTRNIINFTDVCLLVSEPDSVSAAANKALCFQMGIEMQDIQSFQLFNKITADELEHYSKVATSAFFSNLPPMIFNWGVRTTFVYSQIPSDKTVDAQFGKDILKILLAIFPEYEKEIKEYKKIINDKQRAKLKIQIKVLEDKEKRQKRIKSLRFLQLLIPIIIAILMIMYFLILNRTKDTLIFTLIALTITLFLEMILVFQKNTTTINSNSEIDEIKKEINHYMVDLEE